jgi:hypothetical protein
VIPPDAAGAEDAGGIVDAPSCGVAATYILTANPECMPCLQGPCCMADQVCSINPSSSTGCIALLVCMESCGTGQTSCLGGCENVATTGITPYNDLAACISMNCSPECPALPLPTLSDL